MSAAQRAARSQAGGGPSLGRGTCTALVIGNMVGSLTGMSHAALAQTVDRNEYSAEFYGLGTVRQPVGALLYAGATRGFSASNEGFNSYQAAAVATLRLLPWPLDGWAGFLYRFTNNYAAPNLQEYRPFVVVFASTSQNLPVRLSMLSRAEYLFKTSSDGSPEADYWRLRTRAGFDFPLGRTAWKEGSWYGLADVEPLFEQRSGSSTVDEVRVRFGVGYLISVRWIAEAVWTVSLLSSNAEPLQWERNMFRFRFKYRWEDLGRLVAAGIDF